MSALEYEGVSLTIWENYDGVAAAVARDANQRASSGWRLVSHANVTSLNRSAGWIGKAWPRRWSTGTP
jgi:hypothetical protein